ncbi:hypothetical protein PInf_007846 [Phytophthora infestans]|nr:hypothetical protein PInf_007846 [Phytophthora infestans]
MEKLTRLQQTHDGNSKPKDMTVEGDDWFSRATNAYDERIRSERSNQLLKMILMKRIKVFESVRKRLRQRDVLEDLDYVERLQPTTDRPFFQPNCTGFILSHLESKLWSLRLQANVVVPTVSPNRHVTFHTQPGYMVGGEKCFEISAITPLACSAHEAGDLLWRLTFIRITGPLQKPFPWHENRVRNIVTRPTTRAV